MTPSQPSSAVLEAAADWFAVLRADQATPRDRQRWRAWLEASAEHQAAWRHVERLGQTFAGLQQAPDPVQAADSLLQAHQRLRQRRGALACIVGAAGAGALGLLAWPQASRWAVAWGAQYQTATGERRQIALADGTQIWLNTATALNVDFTPSRRRIVLLAGEIFIDTAKDPARGFVVDTEQGRLRALGTRFNVRQAVGETQLAVYEGSVEATLHDGRHSVIVPAGRQLDLAGDHIGAPQPADMARQAWTRGLLLAHDIALRDVVQELRRHRRGHIGVDDAVAELKVYGSFPLGDTDRALAMLATVLPVRIHQPLPWWTRVEARPL